MAEDRLAKILRDNRPAEKRLSGRPRKRWKESLDLTGVCLNTRKNEDIWLCLFKLDYFI